LRAALVIAHKDLQRMVRDRSAIVIAVVAPFALAALFSTVLGGVEDGLDLRWGIVDLDRGPIATALRDGPLAGMQEEGTVTLQTLPTEAEARSAVDEGRVATAVVIPEGFSAAVMSGAGTTVELVVDPDASLSAQVARAVLAAFAHEVEAVQLAVATTLALSDQAPDPATAASLAEAARALPPPVTVAASTADDRRIGNATYYAAAMAILFVFLAAQMNITSLHAEKRQRTLARMLAAPVAWSSIVAGKVLVSLALACLSMGVIVVGTTLLLGADFGDPLSVTALIVSAAMAAVGVGMLVVGFTRSEEQAGNAVAVVGMLLAILGGAFFPASQGPEIMARLSLLTPHAWFVRGVGEASAGGGIAAVGGPVLVLALIGLVCAGLGLARLRRLVLT
jgi:ABC-2 type transport system permease protein